jgi:hypothetical protein
MYTIYDDGGDTEVFERPDGTRDRNEFVFAGFRNTIHPYHKKQTQWAIEMLASAGVHLHVQEVSTVDDIGDNADKGVFTVKDLRIKSMTLKEGRNFILIQDTEMGRGWAVLLDATIGKKLKIITQDHRDTVRDQTLLDEKWLKKQGVSVNRQTVKDLDKLK